MRVGPTFGGNGTDRRCAAHRFENRVPERTQARVTDDFGGVEARSMRQHGTEGALLVFEIKLKKDSLNLHRMVSIFRIRTNPG